MSKHDPLDSFVWFRWSVAIGWFLTVAYAAPGILHPTSVAEFLGAQPPYETVWPAFGFLLTFLAMLFAWPVLVNPLRYEFNAIVGIISRFAFFIYWFWVYPQPIGEATPWVAWLELAMGIVQTLLYTFARRDAVTNPSLIR
ncbi:MAG: hypothetical protein IT423_17565 [Pirellulaceae bacterium]|nr:hypothetical protein [Pirellulaceae bacterium]